MTLYNVPKHQHAVEGPCCKLHLGPTHAPNQLKSLRLKAGPAAGKYTLQSLQPSFTAAMAVHERPMAVPNTFVTRCTA